MYMCLESSRSGLRGFIYEDLSTLSIALNLSSLQKRSGNPLFNIFSCVFLDSEFWFCVFWTFGSADSCWVLFSKNWADNGADWAETQESRAERQCRGAAWQVRISHFSANISANNFMSFHSLWRLWVVSCDLCKRTTLSFFYKQRFISNDFETSWNFWKI